MKMQSSNVEGREACGKNRCNKVGCGQGHVKITTFLINLDKYPAVCTANNARAAFPL